MSTAVLVSTWGRFEDITHWCDETLGAEHVRWWWYNSDVQGYRTFVIDREKDATLFILKWK